VSGHAQSANTTQPKPKRCRNFTAPFHTSCKKNVKRKTYRVCFPKHDPMIWRRNISFSCKHNVDYASLTPRGIPTRPQLERWPSCFDTGPSIALVAHHLTSLLILEASAMPAESLYLPLRKSLRETIPRAHARARAAHETEISHGRASWQACLTLNSRYVRLNSHACGPPSRRARTTRCGDT
jgi:hypothetical protein